MTTAERVRLDDEAWVEDLPKIMEVVSDLAAATYGRVPFKEVLGDNELHPPFVDRMGQVMDTSDDVHADIERLMDAVRKLPSEHQNNVFMYLGGYSQKTLSLLASGDVEESVAALSEALKQDVVEPAEETVEAAIEPVVVPEVVVAEKAPRKPRARTRQIAKPAVKEVVDIVVADEPVAEPDIILSQASRLPLVRLALPVYRDKVDFDPDEHWSKRGLCAQTDPEAFFPDKGGSTRDAKRVCTSCEVRSECLHDAISTDERFGILGGLSERERRKVRKKGIDPDTAILTAMPDERLNALKRSVRMIDGDHQAVMPTFTEQGRLSEYMTLVGIDTKEGASDLTDAAMRAQTIRGLLRHFYPRSDVDSLREFLPERKARLEKYFLNDDPGVLIDEKGDFPRLIRGDLTEFFASVEQYRVQYERAPHDESFADHFYAKGAVEHKATVTNIKSGRSSKTKPQLTEQSA